MIAALIAFAVSVLVLASIHRLSRRTHMSRRTRLVAVISCTTVMLAVAAVSVASQGWRWQFIPLALAAVLALASAIWSLVRRSAAQSTPARLWVRLLRGALIVLVCGLLAVGVVALWAFPIPRFPAPSGPAVVGTTVVEWVDAARPEPQTNDPADHRFVVAQLWYPAEPASGHERSWYLGRDRREASIVAAGVADTYGFPAFLLDDAARAHTDAIVDARPASAATALPVVLFSPGLSGIRTQNTAWAESLASHGYLVVALDHPYDSAAVVRADKTVIRSTVAATGDRGRDNQLAAGWTSVRAADLRFALSQLAQLNRGDRTDSGAGQLAGRLDTNSVAAVGHSLGGAAALQAAAEDPRFAAAIDIDGLPREPSGSRRSQPTLALVAGRGTGSPEGDERYRETVERVLRQSAPGSYRLIVPGAAHLTFTDSPLYLPPVPALTGSQRRTEGIRITSEATLVFLDSVLRKDGSDVAAQLARLGDLTRIPG